MRLTESETALFYKLWYALTWGINEKHRIVPAFKKPVYGQEFNEEPLIAIRGELWKNPNMIDDFLCGNETGELTETDRGMLTDWRLRHIKGGFIVWKHLSKHSIFMSIEKPLKLYGVCGISSPLEEIVPYRPPVMVETVLLPFGDRIIYDSFIAAFGVSFGKGSRDNLKSSYDKAKETVGIIENMNAPPVLVKPPVRKQAPPKPTPPAVDTKGARVPKDMSVRYVEVAVIIEAFCNDKQNDEFKEVCLRVLAKLCRKRPSPLTTGRARTWACGIVHAVGSVNFMFDKSQPIYMPAMEIAEWFGLSKSTAGNKAAEITKLLNMSYFNAEFQMRSLIDKNPMIWYVQVNGITVDIRRMPRGLQEAAFNKGLIPYIPADKEE